jgi:hypothetical protein
VKHSISWEFIISFIEVGTVMENNPSSSRVDRKIIEKNRRIQMKDLHNKLNSLLPHQTSKVSFLIYYALFFIFFNNMVSLK